MHLAHPVARGTLLPAALALCCPACLVVSPPEYERPTKTPPYLVATQASPSVGTLIAIDELTQFVDFGGAVLSEDDGAPVDIALYIDYGTPNAANLPYKNRVYPFNSIEPGTLAQGPRKFSGIKWFLESVPVGTGCHTITMMASHKFNANVCPVDLDDSSFLVWRLLNCDSQDTECPTECPDPVCMAPCPSCATLAAGAAQSAAP